MLKFLVILSIVAVVNAYDCQCSVLGCTSNVNHTGCLEGAEERAFSFVAQKRTDCQTCSVPLCAGAAIENDIFITQPLITEAKCTGFPERSCFHQSTLITHRNEVHTLENTTCRVLHVVRAKGNWVQCGKQRVRATKNHLFYTRSGLKTLAEVQIGDSMYVNMDETDTCVVTDAGVEEEEQTYFGLNCPDSQVLASGVKASLFELYHTIPAAWMYVMGRLVGFEKAHDWGTLLLDTFLLNG